MTRTSCLWTAKCIFKIFIWEERKSFWFSSVILLNFLPKINRYWTTFETLAEIERDCKEWQLYMGDCAKSRVVHILKLCPKVKEYTFYINQKHFFKYHKDTKQVHYLFRTKLYTVKCCLHLFCRFFNIYFFLGMFKYYKSSLKS